MAVFMRVMQRVGGDPYEIHLEGQRFNGDPGAGGTPVGAPVPLTFFVPIVEMRKGSSTVLAWLQGRAIEEMQLRQAETAIDQAIANSTWLKVEK